MLVCTHQYDVDTNKQSDPLFSMASKTLLLPSVVVNSGKLSFLARSFLVAIFVVLPAENVQSFSTSLINIRVSTRHHTQAFAMNGAIDVSERVTVVPDSSANNEASMKQDAEDGSVHQLSDKLKGKNVPAWVEDNWCSYGERLVVAEWEKINDRENNGWRGRDFMHDDESPVKIVEYFSNYGSGDGTLLNNGGEGTSLNGIVHFTARAESHQGYCHGGSMTAVMDDVVGWAAFLVTGSCQPWTGFTVQINTALRKPIPTDSWLLVRGTISKIEGRKVSVTASIIDPATDDTIHAEGDGLVILNAGILSGT